MKGSTPSVAVLGTGAMGTAVARAFVRSEAPTTVWNRTKTRAEQVAPGDCAVADSPAAALAGVDVAFIVLSDYAACFEHVLNPDALAGLSDVVLVNLTSGTPRHARRALKVAGAAGVPYLDGAIFSYPAGIGTDQAMIFFAGDRAPFDQCSGVFSILAGTCRFMGPEIGAAAVIDCALLEAYYGAFAAMMHGAAMCDAEGVKLEDFFGYQDLVLAVVGASGQEAQKMIATGDYSGDQATNETHLNAQAHFVELCREADVDASFPRALRGQYAGLIDRGMGADEIAALFEIFRRPAG
jgi:3-hydroxyisobutyrate dehydrogenase-like beta-hydroxyacid dehydrogenase